MTDRTAFKKSFASKKVVKKAKKLPWQLKSFKRLSLKEKIIKLFAHTIESVKIL